MEEESVYISQVYLSGVLVAGRTDDNSRGRGTDMKRRQYSCLGKKLLLLDSPRPKTHIVSTEILVMFT